MSVSSGGTGGVRLLAHDVTAVRGSHDLPNTGAKHHHTADTPASTAIMPSRAKASTPEPLGPLQILEATQAALAAQQSEAHGDHKLPCEAERHARRVHTGLRRRIDEDYIARSLSKNGGLHQLPEATSGSVSFDREIELNWSCTMEESLPVELKPRLRNSNGQRIGHAQYQDRQRLPSLAWPKKYKQTLARLSRHTKGVRQLAHQMLEHKVRRRQTERSHPEHYAREVLKSDINAVIEEIKATPLSKADVSEDRQTRDVARNPIYGQSGMMLHPRPCVPSHSRSPWR